MTLKADDIIEVSMDIMPQVPDEDEEKIEIDYYINYSYPDYDYTDVSFTEDAECSSFCNTEDYLEQYLENDIEEIDEYEIFDVNNVGEYQTAKIKVISIKE